MEGDGFDKLSSLIGGVPMARGMRLIPAMAMVGICLVGWVLPRAVRAGETRTLTETDGERREPLRVNRDDTIEVRLPEQRGTGYGWRKAVDSTKSLELDGEPIAERGELPGRPGLVEFRRFRFKVSKEPSAKE